MSRGTGHKSNQVLALDTPLSYDPDNEMIWGDESSNKELIFLRADGTSVRRQSLTTRQTTKFATSYAFKCSVVSAFGLHSAVHGAFKVFASHCGASLLS